MLSSSQVNNWKVLKQLWEKKADEKGIILLDIQISANIQTFDVLTYEAHMISAYWNILEL